MNRLSPRTWLALLLLASALVFAVGVAAERFLVTSGSTGIGVSAEAPGAHDEDGGESGESGGGEGAEPSREAAADSDAGAEPGELRPLGMDLESPVLVGGAVAVTLLLAAAVVTTRGTLALTMVIAFATLFAVLDVLELAHQLGESNVGLAATAATLLALHTVAAALAARLVMNARSAQALR